MFIRLLVTFSLLVITVHAAITNSSKGQNSDALIAPKQGSLYDDYDLNEQNTLANNVEGSGGAASLDEYADEEEEEQLSKVTASTIRTTLTTTTSTTTTTTTRKTMTTTTTTMSSSTSSSSTTRRTTTMTTATSTTTTVLNRWMKTTFKNYELMKSKNQSSTTLSPAFNDIDASEFKDDPEEYSDDLEDDAYYNEPTISNKISPSSFPPARHPLLTTRPISPVNHTTPIWILFTFLTRPPIAAGILAGKYSFRHSTHNHWDGLCLVLGLAIGILTSIILLICIIRRYHKREKSHSSYTTGLLYPNQYGYSKSPQEFYA